VHKLREQGSVVGRYVTMEVDREERSRLLNSAIPAMAPPYQPLLLQTFLPFPGSKKGATMTVAASAAR
jgi:hypothetical protein